MRKYLELSLSLYRLSAPMIICRLQTKTLSLTPQRFTRLMQYAPYKAQHLVDNTLMGKRTRMVVSPKKKVKAAAAMKRANNLAWTAITKIKRSKSHRILQMLHFPDKTRTKKTKVLPTLFLELVGKDRT